MYYDDDGGSVRGVFGFCGVVQDKLIQLTYFLASKYVNTCRRHQEVAAAMPESVKKKFIYNKIFMFL